MVYLPVPMGGLGPRRGQGGSVQPSQALHTRVPLCHILLAGPSLGPIHPGTCVHGI